MRQVQSLLRLAHNNQWSLVRRCFSSSPDLMGNAPDMAKFFRKCGPDFECAYPPEGNAAPDDTDFDVIVVGGGHAGCEAATASARTGAKTLLLTHRVDTIGEMSCNPAFGGIGKGTLVREIDAMDGVMARCVDRSGIMFKVLNESRGPAVHGPRAQTDRVLYKRAMQDEIFSTPNLSVMSGGAEDLVLDQELKSIEGVVTGDGRTIRSGQVVITTGTFLRGVIHIGPHVHHPAGRFGDPPSNRLSQTFEDLGLNLTRLTTATPARIDANSVCLDGLNVQSPDEVPLPFSYLNDSVVNADRQVDCAITFTNERTHNIIREHTHLLPAIHETGTGPRYCVSIEGKIKRFADKDRHQVWLEPEGLDTDHPVIYPNGLSTGFPPDVQQKIINSIRGLENAVMLRPGYAVEYDFVDPRQVSHELQVRSVRGLFLAGQINGTTGYEEAGAQGLIAGVNAARLAQVGGSLSQHRPFTLDRADGYTGVMIDDLVTRGVAEPYRVFTSRAEYRLVLRADNADLRLTQKAFDAGAVSPQRMAALKLRNERLAHGRKVLRDFKQSPPAWMKSIQPPIRMAANGVQHSAFEMLRRQDVSWSSLAQAMPDGVLDSVHQSTRITLWCECLYEKYIVRQRKEFERVRKSEHMLLPPNLDYSAISQISAEETEKLSAARPRTIGEVNRLQGVRASTVVYLHAIAKRQHQQDLDLEASGISTSMAM